MYKIFEILGYDVFSIDDILNVTLSQDQIKNKDLELKQALQRENDMKEMVKKYEHLQFTMQDRGNQFAQ